MKTRRRLVRLPDIVVMLYAGLFPLACNDGDGLNDGGNTDGDDLTDNGNRDGTDQGDGGCSVVGMTPLADEAFTGSDSCAGVMDNLVFRSADESNSHNDAHCETVKSCSSDGCPAAPGFADGVMIVYVGGSASGCEATATIEEVRACDTEVQVDYRIKGTGLCGTMVNAWASAWVPASQLPVVFNKI